jgi:hypothetical protein
VRPPQFALIAATTLALGSLWLGSGGAAAPAIDPGGFAHCASITAADERLACYDSLARPKPSAPSAANAAPAAGKVSAHSATAPGATSTSSAAATAAPVAAASVAAAAGTAAATADPAAKSFGLMKHTAPSEQGPDRIHSQATRVDTDRLGNVRLTLDNGQVWTFNAPDALIRVGDPVTIKRGALGSFLLTTPAHHTYKAQRSQ